MLSNKEKAATSELGGFIKHEKTSSNTPYKFIQADNLQSLQPLSYWLNVVIKDLSNKGSNELWRVKQ